MAIHIRVYDTESVDDIARKIYFNFDVNASCTVYGFVMNVEKEELIPKGEAVLQRLKWWYETENFRPNKTRKYNFKPEENHIGGPIAHKIFSWDKKVIDSEPRYTIWRIQ